jgi:hypothetical protein
MDDAIERRITAVLSTLTAAAFYQRICQLFTATYDGPRGAVNIGAEDIYRYLRGEIRSALDRLPHAPTVHLPDHVDPDEGDAAAWPQTKAQLQGSMQALADAQQALDLAPVEVTGFEGILREKLGIDAIDATVVKLVAKAQ